MWNTCRKLNSTAPRAGIQGPAGGFVLLDATEEGKVAEEAALGAAFDFPVRDRSGEERNRASLGSRTSENIVSQRHAFGGMMVNQMASSQDGAVYFFGFRP